jgi:hypothetical protein
LTIVPKVFDYLFCGKTQVVRHEQQLAVFGSAIVDEHPEDRRQAVGFVLETSRVAHDFDVALASSLPPRSGAAVEALET